MKMFWLRSACFAAAAAVGACGTLGSFEMPTKKIEYKSAAAKKLPSLEVPPDLTRPTGDERFVVPEGAGKGTVTYRDYARERVARVEGSSPAAVLPTQQDARVERAGTQRWLVVSGDPEKLWPVVKEFWLELGFIVDVEMPEAGIMETDWAENRARIPDGIIRNTLGRLLDSVYSTSERDKFRTRLERGAKPGTTEIFISHRGMDEVYTTMAEDQTKWQPRPPNPELEAEMLRRLMVRLGVQEERAKTQVAAKPAPPRATLQRGKDGQTLTLDEAFDRAWRRVGLALDRVGFTVEDRDRSKGIYFVRYIDPGIDARTGAPEDRGWFSRFKFWGKSDPKKAAQYRVVVKDLGERAEVNVLNKDGVRDQSPIAARILTLLQEQLR
jgi:outer membrane protein assembly factor BamC